MQQPKNKRAIIQLTNPLDRFRDFDIKLDKLLLELEELGALYPDLGFVTADINEMDENTQNAFKEELTQHGHMVMALINHPLIQVLGEARKQSNLNSDGLGLEVPTGKWQHYKGTIYEMIGPITSTDHHCPGVMYREADKPDGTIYTITLTNFYTKKSVDDQLVARYTKIA